ncbi:MAG: SDR family NAD(P)-dependent oxidoreductase [Chloroflexi bacterium]|nr:SDR family NAD(P)-dependent oxidoreductase [Chloroflexota bacterium]
MKNFDGRVAVVTGAASGIGFALAQRCASEGMKVVLADVEVKALGRAEEMMTDTGATVLSVVTNVSREADIETLAGKALTEFGAVHLLFNNAGVGNSGAGGGGAIWESTIADWEWLLSVNLWGVVHGLRVFVPIMLEQDTQCHIVNTASVAGLISGPGLGIYKVTKHGVVTISETLYADLAQREAKIGVSVLCPGYVNTRILDAERNRPSELSNPLASRALTPEKRQFIRAVRRVIKERGMLPAEVADHVFEGLRDERFYILPHPEWKAAVRTRMDDILQGRSPTLRELVVLDSTPSD